MRAVAVQIRIVLVVWCAVIPSYSQAQTPQQVPGGPVNDFCRLDEDGKRLNAVGEKELAATLLLAEKHWEQPGEVVVVRDYYVRAGTTQQTASQFVTDYHVLARMDSSLSLTPLQMPYGGQPPIQSEHFSLVLTDTHSEIGADGRQYQIKGPTEWRINSYPSEPHVSIRAAMGYVRMMGYHAKDIRTKMNAEKTLAELQEMLAPGAAHLELAGPGEVLSQFIKMQMGGLGLGPGASEQLSTFFIHPESQRATKIGVARAYALKKTTFAGKNATVSIEYGALGELDPQLRFTSLGDRGTIVQRDYRLLLDAQYVAPAYAGHPASEFGGPGRWQIDEAPDEQWVSVATAIKYVTQMRDATRDPEIKANADKSLAILKGLR